MGIRTEPVVWLIIAGLLLGIGWFMIGAGFPAAGDVYFHLRFARDFFNSCVEKVGYPDWDARPYDGKGTPAFRFYAPLAYVITGVFQIFGFPVGFSVKLSILLFAFAGAWGTYQWLISLGKSGWAASGGVFPFFVNPIMALHLFFTFFYQNLCAMLLFPLVLAGFSRAEKDPTSRNGLCLAVVAMGFVCWTHLPSAMMMGYGLITIVFFRWLSERIHFRNWLKRALMVCLLGGGFAAPYILPAVITLDQTNVQNLMAMRIPGVQTDFIDDLFLDSNKRPISYFQTWDQMIGMLVHKVKTSLHLIEDASASPAGYPIAGEMYAWMTVRPWITHVFLLLLVSGAIGLFFSKGSPSFAYGLSGILFLLPAHSVSHPLWTIMPGWHVLQFSWRWLFPASILLLPVIAGLLDGGSELWKKLLIFVAVGSLASFTVALEFLSQPFSEMKLMEMMKTPVYPSEYAPRACEHWQTLNPTIGIPHQMAVMSGSGTLKIHDLGPEHFFLTADIVSEEAEIFLKTHSDPYWRLYSGETVIPLEKQGLCGTMKYRLTRGRHEVRLERVQPDGRTCGWLIMVVTMVTGFLIWRFSKPEESAGQKA